MLLEVASFGNSLRRRNPRSSTARHYTNDLNLFFSWAEKPPSTITLRDIDRYIEACQRRGHASATINRRLASIRSFYTFLDFDSTDPLPNPVIPSRHTIPIGRRLPRDAEDGRPAVGLAVWPAAKLRPMGDVPVHVKVRPAGR